MGERVARGSGNGNVGVAARHLGEGKGESLFEEIAAREPAEGLQGVEALLLAVAAAVQAQQAVQGRAAAGPGAICIVACRMSAATAPGRSIRQRDRRRARGPRRRQRGPPAAGSRPRRSDVGTGSPAAGSDADAAQHARQQPAARCGDTVPRRRVEQQPGLQEVARDARRRQGVGLVAVGPQVGRVGVDADLSRAHEGEQVVLQSPAVLGPEAAPGDEPLEAAEVLGVGVADVVEAGLACVQLVSHRALGEGQRESLPGRGRPRRAARRRRRRRAARGRARPRAAGPRRAGR